MFVKLAKHILQNMNTYLVDAFVFAISGISVGF